MDTEIQSQGSVQVWLILDFGFPQTLAITLTFLNLTLVSIRVEIK
jgi:hypothetical protein